MESKLKELKQRTAALRERLQQRRNDFRVAKFVDNDQQKIEAFASLCDEDAREMADIEAETEKLENLKREVEGDFKHFANVVLTTATAFLGLTVTFSGNLIPEEASAIGWIVTAWIFLAASVVAFPLGSLFQILYRLEFFSPRVSGAFLTGAIFGSGFSCFIIGIVAFLIFSIYNIPTL